MNAHVDCNVLQEEGEGEVAETVAAVTDAARACTCTALAQLLSRASYSRLSLLLI